MNRLAILFLLLSFLFVQPIFSQQLKSTFRVGLNFAKIDGPLEKDDNGNSLETIKNSNGFHVGGGIVYKFLENYGVKAEIMFSQKGGKLIYEGPSEYIFLATSGDKVVATGTRRTNIRTTNSYFEIPVTAYMKFANKRLELFGGASISFLVGSTGVGERIFSGVSKINESPIDEFILNLDYNYRKDDLFNPDDLTGDEPIISFSADGREVNIPQTIGAYFDYDTMDGKFYDALDFGIHGGLNFFLNQGLFVGVTVNYGLTDITNNFYDYSRNQTNGTALIGRSDKDQNFAIQASVGFGF